MNKLSVLALVFSLVALVGVYTAQRPQGSESAKKETAFEQVMRTNELRCGYGIYAPYFTKDPETGTFGGIWHDFAEAVADHIGVKVNWVEVGPADIGVALEMGKIDAYCGALWTAGKRVRVIDFLHPSAFEPILVYVRTDDHRFDDSIDAINNPEVKLSTIDGEAGGLIAAEDFPKVTLVSLPQISLLADMYNQVVTGKADVVLAAPTGMKEFLKNNPGALRPIMNKPVRIYPEAMGGVRYGENDLRDLLNQAQDDVIYNGIMDKLLDKYGIDKSEIWRVAKPYQPPQ